MAQSLAKNLLHLVFSTKNRQPLFGNDIRPQLHEDAGGILRNLDSNALIMNSVEDHLHVLFNLHRTKALSDVVMELKRGTSKWFKEQGSAYRAFYWQAGFGAFSVSASQTDCVAEYIAKQVEHHKKRSFQDEFRALLRAHEIEFDEKYVWE